MKDIQSLEDTRRIDIRKVGVKNISYPVTVLDKSRKTQETVAIVNMYVNLPHQFKGTHMSRFIEILNRFHGRFNLETLHLILQEMKTRLQAEASHIEIAFPYFFTSANVHTLFRSQRYDCRMIGSLEEELDLVVEVEVPVPLLNAKETNTGEGDGGTGFWGTVIVSVRLSHFLWLEDLIELIENSAAQPAGIGSSAETICRRLGSALVGHSAFSWYKVVVENVSSGYTTSASVEGPMATGQDFS